MAQRIVCYQAADGTIHDSEDLARRHDTRNAIAAQATEYVNKHIKTRNISKNRAELLMADFALKLIYPSQETDESQSQPQGDGPPEASDFPDIDK